MMFPFQSICLCFPLSSLFGNYVQLAAMRRVAEKASSPIPIWLMKMLKLLLKVFGNVIMARRGWFR